MIPIKYNVRNLRIRWKTTVMTMLGTGLVVWSSCVLFGLVDGLEHSLNISGDPLDLIVMRHGSTNETTGGFEASKADQLLTLPGIARDEEVGVLAAEELLNIPIAVRENGTRTNVIVRGVQPASRKLRPAFRIIQGRDLVAGQGECIVSPGMSGRFKGAQIGGWLEFGDKEKYQVVGIFKAGGSSAESEIWADFRDVVRNTGARAPSRVSSSARPTARRTTSSGRRSKMTPATSWRRSPNRSISRPRAGRAFSSRGPAPSSPSS